MKRFISLILSLAVVFSLMSTTEYVAVNAASKVETIGVTNTSSLNIRKGAGTSNAIVTKIPATGLVVTYNSTKKDSNGNKWYYVTLPDGTKGYCFAEYVDLYDVYTDADFEAELEASGFTPDYITYLRRLHTIYPNWTFNAVKTGLSWDEVIEGETELGLNCVEDDAYSDVWKSYEQGAYNFETEQFVEIDSGGWITASKEAVKYGMDPRNYMSSTSYIFAMENLSYSSSQTLSNVKNILNGTFMGGDNYPDGYSDSLTYESHSSAVLKAAQDNNISAYHLASRMRVEQGTKGNSLGRGDTSGYEGYFNFFNINAYAYDGRSAITNGARYASSGTSYGRPWNTPYKAINGGAKFLAENYINKGQNTIYFEKFNVVTSKPYTHQYMTNVLAAMLEAKTQKNGYSSTILNSALEFNIPIYEGLPETICKKPSASGSNNNVLKSLSIADHTLTTDFDKYTYSYKTVVDADCDSIVINATPYDSSATVSNAGRVNIGYGTTTIDVICTAETGNTRTYTLNVYRPNPDGDEIIDDKAEANISSEYVIDSSYITKISEKTTIEDFVKKFNNSYTVKVYNKNSQQVTSGLIGNGYTVKLYSGSTLKNTYTALIIGDINGDGKITTSDLLSGQRHLLGKTTLSAHYLKAADINRNGNFTTSDLLAGQRHILGSAIITP